MDSDGLSKLTPAERVNLVHSHKQTTSATVDFHSDDSAPVAAFFQGRTLAKRDPKGRHRCPRTHFRILPEFVPLKNCSSCSNSSLVVDVGQVLQLCETFKNLFASGPTVQQAHRLLSR